MFYIYMRKPYTFSAFCLELLIFSSILIVGIKNFKEKNISLAYLAFKITFQWNN